MFNSNVPSDKTTYIYDVHAVVDNTGIRSVIIDTINRDIVDIASGLNLPLGKHLVSLTVTADVLESKLAPVFEPPTQDDLAQDYMAEQAYRVFEASNGKLPVTNGAVVHDLF